MRGHTRWTGYLVHVTETCDPAPGTVNVITDVATTVSSGDSTGFAREDFTIDFKRRQVTCPAGKITGNWVAAPAMAPYIAARFNDRHCDPCQVRSSCTPGTSARTINFLPHHLHELQTRHRAAQDTPEWKRLYGARSGVEGTVNECVNGHQMRRCRYHGLAKTHVQHVLTTIAINIERLSSQEPGHSTYRPRPPTAFQHYLDAHERGDRRLLTRRRSHRPPPTS